jgi:uncharacterized protein DUF711
MKRLILALFRLDLRRRRPDARSRRRHLVCHAIERYTGTKFGTPDTMTAALAITTAVKAVPVKQIGYSGLMLPVMDDKRLAQRWDENNVRHRRAARVFGGVRDGARYGAVA